MWKKPIGKFQTQVLKGKDVKGLKKIVGDAAVLEGTKDVQLWKLDSRLHVYAADGVPMFVDITGKLTERPVPTVFALWKSPDLLKKMYVNAEVSVFVLNGADVMWPGVIDSLFTPVVKGELVAVYAAGNPLPFAVGRVGADADLKPGKGRAVAIVQHYGDHLSKTVTAAVGYTPPSGFSDERVRRTMAGAVAADAETSMDPAEEEEEEEEEEGGVEAGAECAACEEVNAEEHDFEGVGVQLDEVDDDDDDDVNDAVQLSPSGVAPVDAPDADGDSDASDTPKKGKRHERMAALQAKKDAKKSKKGKEKGAPQHQDPNTAGETEPATEEEMDCLVLCCFIRAIQPLTKADCPMLVSNFYSQRLLACRPEGYSVNLKKSSYKKIGNFMAELVREGVLKIKQKSAGVDQINEINKKALYLREVKTRLEECGNRDFAPEGTGEGGANSSAPAPAGVGASVDLSVNPKGKTVKVERLYRIKGDSFLLAPVAKGNKDPLSAKEINELLDAYIADEEIPMRQKVKGGRGQAPDPLVQVDPVLAKLWNPKKDTIVRTVRFTRSSTRMPLGLKTSPDMKVTEVEANSLAAEVDVRVGDVVVAIDDANVKSIEEMGVRMKSAAKTFEMSLRGPDVCPKEALRSELQRRVLQQTYPAYAIAHSHAEPTVGKGLPPVVQIDVKFRGNNKVTYVNNLDKYGFHIDGAAKELQLFLAGSVTVMSPPVAPASSTILLQGRQVKKLAGFFQTYGIPTAQIMVNDKTAKKK